MSVFNEMERVHTRRQQVGENSAREMFEVVTVESTGTGQRLLPTAVRFKGPFTRRPSLMYGSEIVRGVDLDFWAIPLCTGSVYKFERDDRGFYIGAYLAVRVETSALESGGPEVNPLVRHSFTFLGVSYKQFGDAATASLTRELGVREVQL